MVYLLLTILLTVLLVVIFRYYEKFGVANLPAIVVNYFVAATIGSFFAGKLPFAAFESDPAWLPFGLVIGAIFMGAFLILALTVQNYGVYFTTMVQKVSLVFTVVFAILYFGDPMSLSRGAGVAFALIAIYLITRPERSENDNPQKWSWPLLLLPLVTFLSNGVLDVLFFFLERSQRVVPGDSHFVSFLFFTAGGLGALVLLLQVPRGRLSMGAKEWIGGLILGVPNFFSIYFYILAMGELGGESVVPMVSVGTILCSAIAGVALFSERLTPKNLVGMAFAIAAILLLSLAIQL